MRKDHILEYLLAEKARFESIEKRASERLRHAPEGTVHIIHHKNGVQFYHRKDSRDKNGSYLPVSEKEKAAALVRKKYDLQTAAAAGKQKAVLDRFLKNYDPDCLKKIYESSSDIRKQIIVPVELSDQAYAEQWQSMPYARKEIDMDVPEHYTDKGERVRSKSEVMIADALAQAGVPYRYEWPINLDGGTFHPDFTILRIGDREELYWEHLGMMDDPEYVTKNLGKMRIYEQNGIMPGIRLIVTMETSRQPINLSVIKQMIRSYCL